MPCRCLSAVAVLLLAVPSLAGDEGAPAAVPRVKAVTVTATRTPREVESLTGSADLVTREDLDLKGARTLDEALKEFPGVDVVGDARYGQEVRLNTRGVTSGYGTQRTLVLLDGRPLTDEYLGNVDLAQYPLGAMSRVELVRGPASSVYGSNALGGVVNLIPRRGGARPRTELFSEGGSFGSGRLAFSHGTMFGPVDFFLGVEGSRTKGYLRNSRRDRLDWQGTGGFLNLGLDREAYEVRLYASAFGAKGTDEDFDRDLDRNSQDLKFTWRIDPAEEAVAVLRLYRSQLDQTLDWFDRPATDFSQDSYGAVTSLTWRVQAAHLVTGGLELRTEAADVTEAAGDVDERDRMWAVFLQDEIRVTDDLSVVAGLRYDDRSGVSGETSWRLGANWKVAAGTTLRGAVGRAFRFPTISDRFLPNTQYFFMTFEGNPDLDPEQLLSGELGVTQRLAEGITADLTGYASSFKDFWDFVLDDDGVFRPQNIARVRIYGAELGAEAELGAGFSARAQYSYTDARYVRFPGLLDATGSPVDVRGNRLDDNVRHRGSITVIWRHPAGHTVRLSVLASGNRPTDPENTREGTLHAYYVADLEAAAALTEWATATLDVRNLLNRTWRTRPEFRQPERAIFVGLRVVF